MITARAFGPAGQGVLGLATLWVGVFALVLPMSVGYGFIYNIGQGKISLSQALSAALVFAACIGLIGLPLCYLAARLLGPHLVAGVSLRYLLIASCALPAMVFATAGGLCLTGAGRVRLVAVIGALSSLANLLLCAVLVLMLHLGLTGALCAVGGASYINGMLLIGLVGQRVGLHPVPASRAIVSALRFGLKMHPGFLAQFANYRLDRFIVNFLLGPAAVGIYSTAVVVSELLWMTPAAVATSLYSRATSSQPDSAEITARACRQSLLLVGLLCVVAAVLGPPLIPVVFGQRFAAAGPVLRYLLPGVFALTAAKVVGPYLVGHNRPGAAIAGAVASFFVTVALDLLLIPRLGVIGAGVASSAAYCVGAAISLAWYAKVSRVPALRALVPVASDVSPWLRRLSRVRREGSDVG